ncbi:ribonuclease HIII [uncultured Thomasclavelia sp.]|uniref:ribonuclease HIII n=1 Tax=uncultured Thomasclavelia sp. TaxID=3025759 RepID=UPI0025F2739C|nr:ribonuclease HIII [uncultured Thomasclavelia sp.]
MNVVKDNSKRISVINMHAYDKLATLSYSSSVETPITSQYINVSHIACDETGSADFFGPLCVVSCYVDERDYEWLLSVGVRDPKEMDNKELVKVAKEIKDRIIYSLLILDNSHYNAMVKQGNNLANIKAKLYNQAVTNVMQKVGMPVKDKLVNQFVSPKTYYNYLKSEVIVVKDLKFLQKGEEKYLGIACSNILSRYAYLQYFNNMSRSLKMKLPRGNSNSVDAVAVEVAKKYGAKMLNKVTKTNMTNFKRIKDLI